MTKRYCIFITALFCAFLGLFLAANALSPDRDFSQLENRALQQLPAPSVKTLVSGAFMSDFETYVNDQFVLRDGWIALKSATELALGKQENNGVYFGKQGTLITHFQAPDAGKVTNNLSYVNKFVENVDIPVYFSLIPTQACIWADRLPHGAPTADEKGIIHQLSYETGAQSIDLYAALDAHKSEDIYYRTDHHWTSLGAYYGANALLEEMGLPALKLEDYTRTTVSDSFYGTTFSTSGVRWVRPDRIDTYVPEDGLTVTGYPNGTAQPGSLYVPEKLAEKDKYSFFLGGNQPLCVIQTQQKDAPKVLIVRDSYSDSLAPFLTQRFSELHLFDLRYNLTSVKSYVAEHDIDAVVVLYSFSNFVTGTNLFVLGR